MDPKIGLPLLAEERLAQVLESAQKVAERDSLVDDQPFRLMARPPVVVANVLLSVLLSRHIMGNKKTAH